MCFFPPSSKQELTPRSPAFAFDTAQDSILDRTIRQYVLSCVEYDFDPDLFPQNRYISIIIAYAYMISTQHSFIARPARVERARHFQHYSLRITTQPGVQNPLSPPLRAYAHGCGAVVSQHPDVRSSIPKGLWKRPDGNPCSGSILGQLHTWYGA